jgi:hypothetical protein
MKITRALAISLVPVLFSMNAAQAAVITFSNAISGATSYSFDEDGDLASDVIFSTTDPFGFNTVGPGPNMTYINEPGLEGTTFLSTDLRVDFLHGASGALSFGYAVSGVGLMINALTFNVYNNSNSLLTSVVSNANYTPIGSGFSSFPEAYVTASFSGIASYATFNFNSSAPRYILDNFGGNFGSAEAVPEPGSILLMLGGALGLLSRKRRTKLGDY